MNSIFIKYGVLAQVVGVATLPLYTEGTENVSWVQGINSRTGSGFGGSSRSYTEGGSYITLEIDNTPTGFITADVAGVTNSTVDVTSYTTAYVDWEVISEGTFALIVSTEKDDDINEFDAKVTYGAGTGRKTSSVSISGLSGSHYVRVNAYAVTTAPDEEFIQIRVHRVWLE
jgi:predicted TIM-barrel enzyme